MYNLGYQKNFKNLKIETKGMAVDLHHRGPQVTPRGVVSSIVEFMMLVLKQAPKSPALGPQGCCVLQSCARLSPRGTGCVVRGPFTHILVLLVLL